MAKRTDAAEATPPERPARPLDEGTRLAYERTILAHERTLMAWLRTAVSLITFGFTIYKFFALELSGKSQRPIHQVIGPRQFALIMIAVGLFALLAATLENWRYRKGLRKSQVQAGYSLSALVTALITALGLLALASVIFRW
jgi:putative membrane protein